MKEIAIYVEGGGDRSAQKAELRPGFDRLFSAQKQAAQAKRLRWRLVPSGGRQQTFDAFVHEQRLADKELLCILLVDSEDELPSELPNPKNDTPEHETTRKHADAQKRKDHLSNRDGWDLKGVSPECLHLMVRCMEAWIVADPEALASYYGKDFHAKSLPTRGNLEEEPKPDLYEKLAKATKQTKKGTYVMIEHASKLLAMIDPKKVGSRCPRFATFTSWLDEQIQSA